MKICVVSMTGDPITIGHLDIIERTARLFDKVYILVAPTSHKPGAILSYEEKSQIIADAVSKLNGIFEILPIEGALVDQAYKLNASAIVRGLRNEQDLIYETDMSAINYNINSNIETIYLPCRPELSYVSSSSIRELMRLQKFDIAKKFTTDLAVKIMKKKLTHTVAITGMIGSGKSAAQKIFEDLGWSTIDCDDINKNYVLNPNLPYLNQIVDIAKSYGVNILNSNNQLNKKTLADLIFSNINAKKEVENIAFPVILKVIKDFIDNAHTLNIAIQVPLLGAEGTEEFTALFDKKICIKTNSEICIQRLKEKRGYSDKEARLRYNSQLELETKRNEIYDIIIHNNSDLQSLKKTIQSAIIEKQI